MECVKPRYATNENGTAFAFFIFGPLIIRKMFPVKRLIPFYCLLFLTIKSTAAAFDEKCGTGVVEVVPYNFFSLDFFSKPGNSDADDEVSFLIDSVRPVLHYKFSSTGSDSFPTWFDPQIFLVEKGKKTIQFFCVAQSGDWVKIITNKKTGATKWVELGFDVTFSDWQDFFPTVARIEVVKDDSLLFDNPVVGSTSTALDLNYDHSYIQTIRCKQVSGMWMNVEIVEKDEFGKVINTRSGWIKWRDESEMLIQYFV